MIPREVAETNSSLADGTTWTLTLAAVVIALLYFVSRQKGDPKLPGRMLRAGRIDLSPDDFGHDAEVLRDFSRAYLARGIHMLRIGVPVAAVEPLKAPAGITSADLREDAGLDACRRALADCLTGADGAAIGEAPVQRLISMLSVGPAFAVLTNTGCPPMLQHHRFVIVRGASSLHALIVGFIGEPGQAQWLLTIASPNLLDDASRLAPRWPKSREWDGREGLTRPGMSREAA